MTVTVAIDVGYEFAVKAPFKEVFDLLSDVPESVSHFPKVDKLVDMGDGVYRWEMAKVGTAQVNIQTVYASKYVSDRKKGSVVWTPVPGVGNALVGGSWKISDRKKSTDLSRSEGHPLWHLIVVNWLFKDVQSFLAAYALMGSDTDVEVERDVSTSSPSGPEGDPRRERL